MRPFASVSAGTDMHSWSEPRIWNVRTNFRANSVAFLYSPPKTWHTHEYEDNSILSKVGCLALSTKQSHKGSRNRDRLYGALDWLHGFGKTGWTWFKNCHLRFILFFFRLKALFLPLMMSYVNPEGWDIKYYNTGILTLTLTLCFILKLTFPNYWAIYYNIY